MAHASLRTSGNRGDTSLADGADDCDLELSSLARLVASVLGSPAAAILDFRCGGARVVGISTQGALSMEAVSLAAEVRGETPIRVEVSGAVPILVAPVQSAAGVKVGAVLLIGVEALAADAVLRLADVVSATAVALAAEPVPSGESKLRRALADSRTRYQLMSETVAYAIGVVATDGTIAEINAAAAEVLADTPARLLGRDFREVIAPEDVERAVQEFASRLQGDSSRRDTEIRIVRPNGEQRLLQVRSKGIVADGALVGVYFAARDITEERARAAQLLRAERLASIAPLLSGVCHELNNPLTSIKSFAELMLLDERPLEDQEALEIIQREAGRAGRIVSDLRLIARQTQEEATSASSLDLNELVRRACYEMREEFVSAGIDVIMELTPDLTAFFGVRPQIERVLGQLLTNAVQAMRGRRDPRRITVRSARSSGGVSLSVADTGPGIASEHLENIFDPFWTTRPTGEGTGLGLSLAHSVITDHHGEIRVEGGWGRGATFTLDLPTVTEAARPGRDVAVQTPARTALRILIVDDEGPIRYSLSRYMERRGHTVRDAAEGEQALAMLTVADEEPFDVILADLRMPGLGGEELFNRLQEHGDGLEERLIFITGDAESPDAARLLAQAGVPVVLKPFDLAEIAQIIEAQAGVMR